MKQKMDGLRNGGENVQYLKNLIFRKKDFTFSKAYLYARCGVVFTTRSIILQILASLC